MERSSGTQCVSMGVFELTEDVKLEVKKGCFPKPFLVWKRTGFDSETLKYVSSGMVLSVNQYVRLRDMKDKFEQLKRCAALSGESMAIKIDEKLLEASLSLDAVSKNATVTLTRKRCTLNNGGLAEDVLLLDWTEFSALWDHVTAINMLISTIMCPEKYGE